MGRLENELLQSTNENYKIILNKLIDIVTNVHDAYKLLNSRFGQIMSMIQKQIATNTSNETIIGDLIKKKIIPEDNRKINGDENRKIGGRGNTRRKKINTRRKK